MLHFAIIQSPAAIGSSTQLFHGDSILHAFTMYECVRRCNSIPNQSFIPQTQSTNHKYIHTLTCHSLTCYKCIASVAWLTVTSGCMIENGAGCMGPTHPGARVHAVLAHARQVACTLGIDHAFRLTLHVGVANIVEATRAAGSPWPLAALSVDATRGGGTRMVHLNGAWCGCNKKKLFYNFF